MASSSQNEWEVWNAGNVELTRYSQCPFLAAPSFQGNGWVFKAYQNGSNQGKPVYRVRCRLDKALERTAIKAKGRSDTSIRREFTFKDYSLYLCKPIGQGFGEAWLYVHNGDLDWLHSKWPAFVPPKGPTKKKVNSKATKGDVEIFEDSTAGS